MTLLSVGHQNQICCGQDEESPSSDLAEAQKQTAEPPQPLKGTSSGSSSELGEGLINYCPVPVPLGTLADCQEKAAWRLREETQAFPLLPSSLGDGRKRWSGKFSPAFISLPSAGNKTKV